jgi:hypothetical protein
VQRAIARRKEGLARMEIARRVKEDLKMVALGTSKINYLDPRITVAWCKSNEVRARGRMLPPGVCSLVFPLGPSFFWGLTQKQTRAGP